MLGLPACSALGDRVGVHTDPTRSVGQRSERQPRRPPESEVDGEPTDRIAREQRVLTDLDDLRLGPRGLELGEPRRVRLDDHDHVDVAQVRRRVVAGVKRVVLGKVDVRMVPLEDGQAERLGQRDQRSNGPRIAAARLGDHNRIPGGDQRPCRLLDRRRVGHSLGVRPQARRIEVLDLLQALGQDLAWQREVHGPGRLARRHGEGAIDHGLELGAHAELVVPLHVLAQHARLVERLLGPVDLTVTGPRQRALGQRRAPGREQDRRVGSGGVDDPAGAVGRADVHVHHDDLRPAGDHRVAVGHRDRGDLVRDRQRPGQDLALGLPLGVGVDDRREVGAGIAEEVLDTPGRQQLEVRLGRALHRHSLPHEGASLPRVPGARIVKDRTSARAGRLTARRECVGRGATRALRGATKVGRLPRPVESRRAVEKRQCLGPGLHANQITHVLCGRVVVLEVDAAKET